MFSVKITKEVWSVWTILETTHEGSSPVKVSKLQILNSKFEKINMAQKLCYDRIALGYSDLCPDVPTNSKPLSQIVGFFGQTIVDETEVIEPKVDKGKHVVGNVSNITLPLKKSSKPHTPHFCRHCGKCRHTRPHCYNWPPIQRKIGALVSTSHPRKWLM